MSNKKSREKTFNNWRQSLKIKFLPIFLLSFLFLFLPGNSYYETLSFSYQQPPFEVPVLPSLPDLPKRRFSFSPQLTARAACLIDFDSGLYLFEKNKDEALPPASLTKLMTALVVLDNFSLDQVIAVGQPENYGQIMGLKEKEIISVGHLLDALLIFSANDAAYALADAYPGGRAAFIAEMNRRAKELGLTNTHFTNPNGRYDPNHYSTAADLAKLAMVAWRREEIRRTVAQKEKVVCDVSGEICHPLFSTNELLGFFPGTLGLKTGFTEEAGECFIGFFEENGRRFLSVVLGSKDRFRDTQELVGWGMVNFSYQPLIEEALTAGM